MYRGCRLFAPTFIKPCSPYFLFNEKVCHTNSDPPPIPINRHRYELTPVIYKIIIRISIPSNPPANRNKYCAFSPLNSTVLPMPLLILYVFIPQILKEERT